MHTLLPAGLTLPRGACLAPHPRAALGLSSRIIFHVLLKITVSPPNESHKHCCDPAAAGRERTASHGTAAAPGTGAVLGVGRRTGAAPLAVSHQTAKASPCLASSHCAAHEPRSQFRARALTPRCPTHVPPRAPVTNTCRHGKARLCEGTSILHKSQ